MTDNTPIICFAQQFTVRCIIEHNPEKHYLLKNGEDSVEMYA